MFVLIGLTVGLLIYTGHHELTKGGKALQWTSAGTDTAVTAGALSLETGTTYYFSVKARNDDGYWSDTGYSDGIKVNLLPVAVIRSISPKPARAGNPVTMTGLLLIIF